jgi:hypothetical protein
VLVVLGIGDGSGGLGGRVRREDLGAPPQVGDGARSGFFCVVGEG